MRGLITKHLSQLDLKYLQHPDGDSYGMPVACFRTKIGEFLVEVKDKCF